VYLNGLRGYIKLSSNKFITYEVLIVLQDMLLKYLLRPSNNNNKRKKIIHVALILEKLEALLS